MLPIKNNEIHAIRLVKEGCLRIDPDGSIWRIKNSSNKSGRILGRFPKRADKPSTTGYMTFCLDTGYGRATVYAHRAVWVTHNGPIPVGLYINHKNGVRHDNRIENLELVTPSQNTLHGIHVTGLRIPSAGERHGNSKLSADSVRQIIALRSSGGTLVAIGKRFNVDHTVISKIARGEAWQCVTSFKPVPKSIKKLTMEQARLIRRAVTAGSDHAALAILYGISKTLVSAVVCNRVYKEVAS